MHEDCLDLLLLSLQAFPSSFSLHSSFHPSLLSSNSPHLPHLAFSARLRLYRYPSLTPAAICLTSAVHTYHLSYTPQKPPPPPPLPPPPLSSDNIYQNSYSASSRTVAGHVLAYFLTPLLFFSPFQYSMFLTTAAPLRRGSTPLPVKHQLRREEAISEDCDWIPGLEEPIPDTAVPRDESFSQSAAAQSSYSHGVLRIVLLGQNGVGKSSLALSLAGQSDRSLSIDSETQACGKELLGLGQVFSTFVITCAQLLSIQIQAF